MEVNLRMGAALAARAADIAKNVALERTAVVSVYDKTPEQTIASAQSKLRDALNDALDLYAASHKLRVLLSDANTRLGVNHRLIELRELDLRERLLNTALGKKDDEPHYAGSIDMAFVADKIESIRRRMDKAERYEREESVRANLVTSTDTERWQGVLADIGRRKMQVNQELLSINLTNTVGLDDGMESVFRKHGLI